MRKRTRGKSVPGLLATFLTGSCGKFYSVDHALWILLLTTYPVEIWPSMLMRGWGWPGFPAFSRPTTQFCIVNRPAPGEHVGSQTTFPKYSCSTWPGFQHTLHVELNETQIQILSRPLLLCAHHATSILPLLKTLDERLALLRTFPSLIRSRSRLNIRFLSEYEQSSNNGRSFTKAKTRYSKLT